MAREYAIPSSSTILEDFGLNVTPLPTTKNRRVVIIGTAEDGPMYEPVLVDVPENAEVVWGRQSKGTLVRGISECWKSQDGNQNLVGVRIGNGNKALLEIVETSGNGINDEQSGDVTSLKLEGKFPGGKYNQITIKYDDRRNVALYNPKTGLTSVFSVDNNNPLNTSVDVHNVQELVDAINVDRNMSSVVKASTEAIDTDYELKVRSTTVGVSQTSNGVKLDLKRLIAQSGIIADINNAFIVSDPVLPYGTSEIDGNGDIRNLTVSNNLVQLTEVESVSISEWEEVTYDGTIGTLDITPLDGKGTSRWDTIQAMKDYDDDSDYAANPSGTIVSEFIYHLGNVLTNEIPTSEKGLDELNTFTINSPLPLDDSEAITVVYSGGVAYNYMNGISDYDEYKQYDASGNLNASAFINATSQGIETKLIGSDLIRPSGIVRLFVSDDVDPTGNWTELPYHAQSGIYIDSYTPATTNADGFVTFAVGTAASGCYVDTPTVKETYITTDAYGSNQVKWTNMSALIDKNGNINPDKYIRVEAQTIKGFLSEAESLPQIEALADTSVVPNSYFIRGQEIVLDAPAPYPMYVNYGTRISYEIDTNAVLSDSIKGEISFTDPNKLPGPAGGPLQSDRDSSIRLKYTYLANFPAITSAAKSLKGGTNGASLTVAQQENEFKKAYDYLRDFEADIWVPMEANIDAIKVDYNPTTGLKEELANSYALDIEDFLEDLSINQLQPHAVLGVTEISGETLGDRDAWIKNLTEVDINNPIRGANVMASIQNKFISVSAFEPIFLNIGRGRPYSSNGQAAYAGLLASLPYDISPTNKTILGVTAIRQSFSIRQLEALNSMRYVSMKTGGPRNPVIVNDITAAPYGSDFVAWSTFSITKEAADRIKRVADTYLGRPNSIELRNALDQDISNTLQAMSGLQAFNFTISSTIEQQILGVVEIELIIVPIFTMKKIRTTVKLRKNLAVNN